jgi:hypothetical protein
MGVIDMFGTIDAAADKSAPGAIKHQQADARAIRAIFEGHGISEWRNGA